MGILSNITNLFTGSDSAAAAREGARLQEESINEGIGTIQGAGDTASARFDQFAQFGLDSNDMLAGLILGGKNFADDPFIATVLDEVTRRVNARSSAGDTQGLNSGQNLEDLVNSTFLVGEQRINQLERAQEFGGQAIANQANIGLGVGETIADLQTTRGDVRAGGVIGAQNAKDAAGGNLLNLGLGLAGGPVGGAIGRGFKSLGRRIGSSFRSQPGTVGGIRDFVNG